MCIYNLPVEKAYTYISMSRCRRSHILSRWQALIKFELRVCTERHPVALLRVLPRDFPFLPFPFSQDHCLQDDPQNPARGAKDCYERICGNPRSNLHVDDNGCVSSPLIPPDFVAACYFFKSCLLGSALERNAGGC